MDVEGRKRLIPGLRAGCQDGRARALHFSLQRRGDFICVDKSCEETTEAVTGDKWKCH